LSENTLQSIDHKLSVIIKLLAISTVKEKNKKDQMAFLKMMGLKSSEIGSILGISASTVRVHLHNKKKLKRK